jgi:hypothetical protein
MKHSSCIEYILFWNRKYHIYIGLFLLLFIWLFTVSGLLLNHSQWKFSSFYEKRKESEISNTVFIPETTDRRVLLLNFMDQLKISGEISNINIIPDGIDFRVTVPGKIRDIHIDLKNRVSKQKITVYNFWGKMRILHIFNGTNKTNPEIRPNWIVTRIWLSAMDGISIGLILLCVSSWLMWYEVRKIYLKGVYVLILGFAGALYFILLIRFL